MASGGHGERRKKHQRPPMTDEYQVEEHDTLLSIAVSFGSTTAELRRLNRLQTSLIFPGQVLYVPERAERRNVPLKKHMTDRSMSVEAVPHPEAARPVAEAEVKVELADEALEDNDINSAEPEKSIGCRYVTSNGEGIVPGVLTVTSERLSFHPELANRLVVDRGPEQYSVMLLLGNVTSLGMYENAGQMAIGDPPTPSGSVTSRYDSFLFCSSNEWQRCRAGSPVPVSHALASDMPSDGIELARNALSNSPSPAHSPSQPSSPSALAATIAVATENQATEDVLLSGRVQPVSQPVAIDLPKPQGHRHRKHTAAGKASKLPRYLCVRTQTLLPQMADSVAKKPEYWFAVPVNEIAPLHDFLEAHCRSLEPVEHRTLTETIGSFVIINSFAIEEGLDVVEDFFSSSEAKGCYLPNDKLPSEAIPDDIRKPQRMSSGAAKQAAVQEARRNSPRPSSGSKGLTMDLPAMIDKSEIMSFDHLCRLQRHLPNSVVGCSWQLAYSTHVHGISLRTLYRNMRDLDGPILLAVRDVDKHLFGVLSSTQFRVCDKFLGTGQCFLFTFHDSLGLKIFTWTGENQFFVKGDQDSLCFGSGDGAFGLWLDENLYHGSSHPCKTYDNEILANKEQFIIQSVEAWHFV